MPRILAPSIVRGKAGGVARCLLLCLSLPLFVPTALAEEISGSLTVRALRTPDDTSLTATGLLAFLAEDTRDLPWLYAEGDNANVCRHSVTFIDTLARLQKPPPTQSCYSLPHATIRLAEQGDHTGFLGAHPASDTTLSLDRAASTGFEFKVDRNVADAEIHEDSAPVGDTSRQDYPYYAVSMHELHAFAKTRAGATLQGTLALRIKGPDVVVKAHNTTHEATGIRESSNGLTSERTETWLYVTLERAALRLPPETPVEFAASSVPELQATGQFTVISPKGALHAGSVDYTPSGNARETLDGHLLLALTPKRTDEASLAVLGEVESTSMRAASVPVPVVSGWWGPGLVVLGAVVAAGVGAWSVGGRRRGRAGPASPVSQVVDSIVLQAILERVEEAVGREDWSSARAEMARARGLERRSEFVAAEAFYLRRQQEYDHAIGVYEEAARLGDKTAYVGAAICAIALNDHALATLLLQKGIQLSREMVDEIRAEPLIMTALRGREDFEALMRNAENATGPS